MSFEYKRVFPRDLFNDASLLKCYAQLTMLVEDGLIPGLTYEYDDEPYDIDMDTSDGSTFVRNIQFYYKGRLITFRRPLNSRLPWPLVTYGGDDVFDIDGRFKLDLNKIEE